MSILDDEIDILDSQEIFIKNWIKRHCTIIGTYIIKNNEININGDITLYDVKLLPYPFQRVTGSFIADGTALKSLKNTPRYVGDVFNINRCDNLLSLRYGPEFVAGLYTCRKCEKLISPMGLHKLRCHTFDCTDSNLFKLRIKPDARVIRGARYENKSLIWKELGSNIEEYINKIRESDYVQYTNTLRNPVFNREYFEWWSDPHEYKIEYKHIKE